MLPGLYPKFERVGDVSVKTTFKALKSYVKKLQTAISQCCIHSPQ